MEQLGREAAAFFRAGRFAEAIHSRISLFNARRNHPERDDFMVTATYMFAAGDFNAAISVLEQGREFFPDDLKLQENLGIFLMKSGRPDEAETLLRHVLEEAPDNINVHDVMAQLYGVAGNMTACREHGLKSLQLKEMQVAGESSAMDLKQVPIPAFDVSRPERNVISFSLWGENERYLRGARENIRAARYLYPGWRCRFYCADDVPAPFRTELLAEGGDVVLRAAPENFYEGLFWRFEIADDDSVDRYLVRDADSIVSLRERMAVNEWLESDWHFHILRDGITHTELILAGLWGGVRGALPPLKPLMKAFPDNHQPSRTLDQLFLRTKVWPTARTSCLIHDSLQNPVLGTPFPPASELPEKHHVGENHYFYRQSRSAGELREERTGNGISMQRKHFLFTISPGRCGTRYLTELLKVNLDNAEVHHERIGPGGTGRHSPDAFHLTEFNTHGNTPDVRDFWHQKFMADRYGPTRTYAELSHFLCKGGLVENLDLVTDFASVDLLMIDRDLFDLTWSFANRFDFANRGFTWLFALDPGYRRTIVPSDPYTGNGMIGACFWYALEMKARSAYYEKLLSGNPHVKCHHVQFETVITQNGARSFLEQFENTAGIQETFKLPGKLNETKAEMLGQPEKDLIQQWIEGLKGDPGDLGARYFDEGNRL